jgi:predicted nucleotidyltransferase
MVGRGSAPCLADVDAVVASLAEALAPERDVRSAWLFGSVAAGRARKDSDVDVGVWMDGPCGMSRLSQLTDALQDRTGLAVEVVLLDRATPPLARAATNGIRLLCRDERAEIEWVLAKWREAEDWDQFLFSFLQERRRSRGA